MPQTTRSSRPRQTAAGLAAAVLLTGAALTALPNVAGAAPPVADPTGDRPRTAPALKVPKINWRPCRGAGLGEFQCATVEVPLDYDRPRGTTTTIALTRLRATDPKRKLGTLFTNPGGPGGSGVDFVQQGAKTLYSPAVRARFDILGFDPRGQARSDPATCYRTAEAENAALADSLPFPVTPVEEDLYLGQAAKLALNCARTSPTRLKHISTANVARDMDLLRRAVGDDKLTYAGYSYGTFLGATYAKLFPTKIRALVLDGTLDPREYVGTSARYRNLPVGARTEQTLGGAQVFKEFLRLCKAVGPQRCSLAGLGDPATVARATLNRVKREPVELTLPDGTTLPISYQLLVAISFSALYSPTEWTFLADLYTVVAAAESGRRASAAKVSPSVATLVARVGEDYDSVGGSLGSTCVDTRTPSPLVFPQVADAQDRAYPDFGRYRTWIALPCYFLAREGIADGDAYRGSWTQRTSSQVLVVGTRFDAATPYKNTRPYAGLFRNASVLTLEGWGHTALGKSACIDTRVARYLVNPRVDRPDATCRTEVVPFAPTPAADARTMQRPDVPPGVARI